METIYATVYRGDAPPGEYVRGKQRDAEERRAWITRRCGGERTHPRLLDVGCSEGTVLAAFKERGWEVYGVEPTSSFACWGQDHYGVPIHIGSFDDGCYPDTQFDLVILSHVLEHIHDPDGFMKLVVKRLASDGSVFVEVPDLTRLEGDIAGYLYGAPHLYGFSRQTLRRFLAQVGLRVRVVEPSPKGIRALADRGPAGEREEALPDAREAYRSLRRRLLWHRAQFFVAGGWKDALKWRLIDILGAERAESLLGGLRSLGRWGSGTA